MVRLGEFVRLVCPISAYKDTMFEWKKDSETIDDYTWDRLTPAGRILKIRDVAKEDSGEYVCRGINGYGSEDVTIELFVIGEIKFFQEYTFDEFIFGSRAVNDNNPF